MLLTVEVEITKKPWFSKLEIGEVAICLDEEGIELLEKQLEILKREPDHVHLMTPSWGVMNLQKRIKVTIIGC